MCKFCGFDHGIDEMCREAESYFGGNGFIPYKNGVYIKPTSCGTCKHWQTCDSTEGWRINMPCTGIAGVKWERKES